MALIAAAGTIVTASTADRTAVEEVTTAVVTEVRTELGLPLQPLQGLEDLTEVDLGIEATEGTEGLAVILRFVPLVDNRICIGC